MKRSRFRVVGKFDMSVPQVGTVTIDRGTSVFAVRPLRRRRDYYLPLDVVAEMVCHRVIRAELLQKRSEKARLKKEKAAARRR